MHFVAALDTVPEMRGVLGLFEGVATGAADGYARMAGVAGVHAAAPRAGARQRAGQPAQRPQGGDADGQHRRRPRHVPRSVRRAAGVRHRDRGAQRVAAWVRRPERTADLGRVTAEAVALRDAAAGAGGDADPAGRRVVERRRRAGGAAGPPRPGPPVDAEAVEQVVKVLRSGEPVALLLGMTAMRREPLLAAARDRRRHRRPAVRRDVRRPHRARRRHPAHREDPVLLGDGRAAAGRDPPPRARRRHLAGDVLRLPRPAERPRARGLRGARAGHRSRRRRRRAGRSWPTTSAPTPDGRRRVAAGAADAVR